jgi:hypothetical protein
MLVTKFIRNSKDIEKIILKILSNFKILQNKINQGLKKKKKKRRSSTGIRIQRPME